MSGVEEESVAAEARLMAGPSTRPACCGGDCLGLKRVKTFRLA